METNRMFDLSKVGESGAIFTDPIIHKGVLYFGAADTFFYAIDVSTGQKLWTFKTGGPIYYGGAAIKNDTIYFGSFDSYLYALNLNGQLEWKFLAGGGIVSVPVIHKGVIYFGCLNGHFYAVDLKNQKQLWIFRTGDEIVCYPIIHNDRAYFGSKNGYFYCLNLAGQLVWKFRAGDAILPGTPAIGNGCVYFNSTDQNLYALTLEKGTFKWCFRTGEPSFNAVLYHAGKVYFCSRDRYLYCLNAKTGICEWRFMQERGTHSKPVIYKNMIYMNSGRLYALNMSGIKVWAFLISDGMNVGGAPVAHDDKIFFGTTDAFVRAVGIDGKQVWQFKVKGDRPPIWRFKGFMPAPKWDPTMFDKKTVEKAKKFKPYTLTADKEKIYGGIDTTGLDVYSFGEDMLYKEKRTFYKEGDTVYKLKGKKKKDKDLDKWLKDAGM